ncbi:MDR family MFS transporter [Methylocapsa sp. S129]|uniref:MDR family MFS transporter n=1 Tax=Methylocapsa sp. S129 TaxID=1641869 RepID=UPI00131C1793|nr:MDR family MFS transporter [Methylocapsa sp. S129]
MDMSPPQIVPHEQRRDIVIGVLVAMMLAALDQTIVAPALPTIGASLGDADFLAWIISVYLLTGTAVTPLYGKLSDIHGRRPIMSLALGIFLVGSVICALAPSMPVIIFGRAIQGLGGGGLVALAQTVIADVVPPRERSRYVVYISTVWATSSVAGPILGGFFAQHLSWSLIFWINLPIGALAFFMTHTRLKGLPQIRRDHRLDVLGAALITSATVALMLVLTLGGARLAWTSPIILALALAAALLTAMLLVHLRRAPEALIPLDIFRNEVVGTATASIFFSMFAFIGSTVYLPIYFEFVLGKDSTVAGAGLIALVGGSVIGATIAGRTMPRIVHYKRVATIGLCFAIIALAALSLFASGLSFWQAETLVFVLGIGVGPLFPTATVSVQNAVDRRDLGVATATLAFLRTFGSALGVALMGAVVIGFGIVTDAGVPQSAGAIFDPELAQRAGLAFTVMFALQGLALAISLACFLMMEERPLRGSTPSVAALAE